MRGFERSNYYKNAFILTFFKKLTYSTMNNLSKFAVSLPIISSMLLSAPVFAENDKPAKAVRNVDLACMSAAVTVREDAIAGAVDAFHTHWKGALATRKAALLKAWEAQDNKERRLRIKAATDEFKKVRKEGRMVYNRARNGAWDDYRKAHKACGAQRGDAENMAQDNA